MVIEWLQFRVAPERQAQFIQADAEIWTATLAAYPGFLSKEVWLNPERADEVTLAIRWQTRSHWSAIPAAVLAATAARFIAAFGAQPELIAAREYAVQRWEPVAPAGE